MLSSTFPCARSLVARLLRHRCLSSRGMQYALSAVRVRARARRLDQQASSADSTTGCGHPRKLHRQQAPSSYCSCVGAKQMKTIQFSEVPTRTSTYPRAKSTGFVPFARHASEPLLHPPLRTSSCGRDERDAQDVQALAYGSHAQSCLLRRSRFAREEAYDCFRRCRWWCVASEKKG